MSSAAPDVLVVAHRGSSVHHPEHTLAAYRSAIAEGADALECDVRLTRDGVLVCVHDRRVDRTSNGRGPVSTLELADLAELDFASWRGTAADEDPDRDASSVLTLERLLQVVLRSERRVQLHIETKHPTRYGGQVERTLVDLLADYDLLTPEATSASTVTVMSFAATSLRRVHALAPCLPTVYLMLRVPPWFRDGSLPSLVRTAGPSLAALRAQPSYVRRAHDRGNRVHVWTVDQPADVDLVLELGVDAVISNDPTGVLSRLGRTGPQAS